MKIKWILGGLLIAGILILLITGLPEKVIDKSTPENRQKKESPKETGFGAEPLKNFPQAAFNLKLINSEGEIVDFQNFKGKVIFMNMWATWCAPCVEEMPGINNLYNQLKADEEMEFVMISHDREFETAKKFIKKNKYDFEIYKVMGRFPEMYNAGNLPATYIINSEGELVVTHLGMGEYGTEEFRKFLLGLK